MARLASWVLLAAGIVVAALLVQRPWQDSVQAASRGDTQIDCFGYNISSGDNEGWVFIFNPSSSTASVKRLWLNKNATVLDNDTFVIGPGKIVFDSRTTSDNAFRARITSESQFILADGRIWTNQEDENQVMPHVSCLDTSKAHK